MYKKFLTLVWVLLLAGCGSRGSGSGGGDFLSSLFDIGSSATSFLASGLGAGGSPGAGAGAGGLATGGTAAGTVVAHTPEPSTIILMGIGLAGVAFAVYRKNKK